MVHINQLKTGDSFSLLDFPMTEFEFIGAYDDYWSVSYGPIELCNFMDRDKLQYHNWLFREISYLTFSDFKVGLRKDLPLSKMKVLQHNPWFIHNSLMVKINAY